VGARELDIADDRAAVLDWRPDSTGLRKSRGDADARPLPGVPAIPERLAHDPQWGEYLTSAAS
jgi:hypothetical protein